MALIRTIVLSFLLLLSATVPATIRDWRPKIIDKWLHIAQDGYAGVIRYHSRGGMKPKIIVIHVQDGNNWGSWQWFHQVLASATVLIGKNGDIWNLVPKHLAPWTNGDVRSPSYFMQTILNRWGWDPNTYSLTIEREGTPGERTEAQDKSIVWQVWQWMQEDTIDAIYIVGHYEVNSESRPNCPDYAPHPIITMVKDAVSGTGVPVIEVPDIDTPIPGHDLIRAPWPVQNPDGSVWKGDKDITINGILFHAEPRTVTAAAGGVNRRQWASSTANLTGTAIAAGETVRVLGWVEGEDVAGERRWWVGDSGSRVWAGGTVEKPKATAPVPVTPDDGVSQPDQGNNRNAIPVVLNGNTYYPVDGRDTDGKIRRPVRTKVAANVRLWAATHAGSPVVETLPPGATFNVTHWVRGEAVDIPNLTDEVNRDIWYVLEHEFGDGVRKGGRIWSGLIELL